MNTPSPQAHPNKPLLLGDVLVKSKLITPEQLQEVLAYQATLESYRPLGLILVDKNLITVKQLNHFLDINRKRPKIGEVLVSTKAITREQLDMALTRKKTTRQRLGQILLELGYLKEEALHQALAIQMNVPFVDLDHTTLGTNVEGFIPKNYAIKNRAVPINASPKELTIAVEDPTNFVLMAELQTMTKLQVIIVTSTKDMISRAIQRVYVTNQLTGELVIQEGFQFAEAGKAF
jgi:hypothetical protein